ncbi:splicing factor U2AF 65 kDa subunit-like protein [Phlyctochytrium arcticum]|nr:splicing factor U2AF 65 kDa subunit-like protein [Phlyctochytrium arcticum]
MGYDPYAKADSYLKTENGGYDPHADLPVKNEAYYDGDMDRERRHHRSDRKRDKDRSERRRDRSGSRSRGERRKRSRSRGDERDKERKRDRDREGGERRRSRSRDRDRERDRRRSDYSKGRDSRDSRPRKSSKSASPRRPSRHNPDVVPIHLRPRKLNNWDVAPTAFPGMTAMQVKATGHFPLPGQSSRLASGFGGLYSADLFGIRPEGAQAGGAVGAAAQSASIARQARRLYVGNIPYGIQEDALLEFFNQQMEEANLKTATGLPVIAAQINLDKNYAFVEFRSHEEATAAMAFDGLAFAGQSLKIRRPKDYQPQGGISGTPPSAVHVPGVVSTQVPDSANKIFVGGLPPFLNDEQVMELLKSFGELRAFNLVKDGATGLSKGFAFCEYLDAAITDIACEGLHGMELGDKKLIVQRASVGATKAGMPMMAPLLPGTLLTSGGPMEATTVLLLLNMITKEELTNDEDYQDILDDIKEECGKYGVIQRVTIPRPMEGQEVRGVGKIFVHFTSPEETAAALRSLAGRKFADRTVVAAYFDEQQYLTEQY